MVGMREVTRAEYEAIELASQEARQLRCYFFEESVRPTNWCSPDALVDRSLHPQLVSAGHKIRRAHSHLNSLHDYVTTHRESHRVRLVQVDRNAQPDGNGQIEYRVQIEPIGDEVGVIIGDIVTNAQAVLDHLVWGVTKRSERSTANKRSLFPCVHTPNTNDPRPHTKIRHCVDGHRQAHRLVESFQPYPGRYPNDYDPLTWLGVLVGHDKHRTLTPVANVTGPIRAPSPQGGLLMANLGAVESGDMVKMPPLVIDSEGNAHALIPPEAVAEIVLMKIVWFVEQVWVAFEKRPWLFTWADNN
jgi:hypothetical protein